MPYRLLVILALASARLCPCLGQIPIERLPAIDATQSEPWSPTRVGSRPGNDPRPPTGIDWDAGPPSTPPSFQLGYPSDEATSVDEQFSTQAIPPLSSTKPSGRLSSFKSGFFQKFSLTGTWLDGDTDKMGLTEIETFLTVALPLPTKDQPLLITPTFETYFLKGPLTPDVPGTLYSAYAQFIWAPKITERWRAILGIEPGVYSDFQGKDQDGFRLLGRGLIHFQWVPERFEILAGLLYLDREDVRVLPAGGVIWMPNDDMRYEIVFPKPKLAHRVYFDGRVEHWVYLSGEFGGDSWAIRRASGLNDRLTLRDVRVMLGAEQKLEGGAGAAIEVGYVFSREIEYASATPDVSLDSTFLLRGVFRF